MAASSGRWSGSNHDQFTISASSAAAGDRQSLVNGITVNGSDETTTADRPFLIGVAGGTASGKSTVCSKIIEGVGSGHVRHVEVVSQECFYRDLNENEQALAMKGQFDFDHPDAFDEELMIRTLKDMMQRKCVTIPVYDFLHHKRSGERVVYPADVILYEGILVFYFKPLLDLFNVKLFVDTDADTRLARRVARDMKERHRTLDHVINQYMTYVKPAFEEFCLPTKKYADIIIPRGPENIVAVDLIVQHIQDLLRHGRSSEPAVVRSLSIHSTDSTTSFKTTDESKYASAH
jgi:uridine kinase